MSINTGASTEQPGEAFQPMAPSEGGVGTGAAARLIHVVIGDSHPLVLEGLSTVLGREPGVHIAEQCVTGADLLEAIHTRRPDLAVFDTRVSAPDGLEVLKTVRKEGLSTLVILLSESLEDDEVLEGIRLGIRGLVAKNAPVETLLQCVRTVLQGGTCLDQSLVGRAMASMLSREAALRDLSLVLTARELQVVRMVGSGCHNRHSAERLFVSAGTLKVHLHHIYEKLQLTNRDELIAYVRAKGLS
jgi:two-component system nitrate/nitrite response regulator NarL